MTDQQKKPITTATQARAEAKICAGLIIDAVLAEGWAFDQTQVDRFGKKGAVLVAQALTNLAEQLSQGVRVG